jgi:hypothetical protein
MKIKNGFISRTVAGNNVVVAVGEQSKSFNGIIKLNESGLILWNKLVAGADKPDLVSALLEEYDISAEVAEGDVDRFVGVLRDAGAIED